MKNNLLLVNVYFAPKSFGGATVVAEQLAIRLNKNWNLTVITTMNEDNYPNYHAIKYKINNINVISINIPNNLHRFDLYKNENFAFEFSKHIASLRPKLIHFHSIQTMGAEMLEAAYLAQVPFVVTAHDNWWICERQFMIDRYNKYCWQRKIDINKCKECMQSLDTTIGDYGNTEFRFNYLQNMLKKASAILFPSQFQLKLYKDNVHDSLKLLVNKNGIKFPNKIHKKDKKKGIVRFGFVGGNGPIKGLELIEKAFMEIDKPNYELVIVDNTMNLGFSSIKIKKDLFKGKIVIVPAYTQNTMDDFFSKIDVLLFPSQWKESFGLTVREALARDVWVLSTDSGGTIEDIKDGKNGTIIPLDGNYFNLRTAILNLLNKDFINYSNLYKNEITTYDEQSQELEQYYDEIINNNRKKL